MLDLEFYVLPGKIMPQALKRQYTQVYETFRSHGTEALPSSEFTRQDYVQALFHKKECIAVDCVREINLANPADLDDPWFKVWKRSHLAELVSAGYERCLVKSHFTLHKDYQKTAFQDQWSVGYIMGSLSVLYQLELDIPLMFSMMRSDHAFLSLTKKWGGRTIESNVMNPNGKASDLIIFAKNEIRSATERFPDLVLEIYEHKTDHYVSG